MKRRYRIEPDGIEVDLIYHDEGLFAMCDFLGYSEYVLQNNCFEVYDTIMNELLGKMITIEKDVKLNEALDMESLRNKLGENWLSNVSLSYKIISDSFIIYPNLDVIENEYQSGFLLYVMSGILEIIYSYILKLNKGILLRGVIMNGKFAYTNEYNVIMGKGVIEAYRYEKMQNWSGILIHPNYHALIKKYSYQPDIGIQYEEIPLKNNLSAYSYKNENAKKGLHPYVINWVDKYHKLYGKINDEFWYNKIDRLLNSNCQDEENAIEKIKNTKKFYDYVVNRFHYY